MENSAGNTKVGNKKEEEEEEEKDRSEREILQVGKFLIRRHKEKRRMREASYG
jgi:hypothetical protein